MEYTSLHFLPSVIELIPIPSVFTDPFPSFVFFSPTVFNDRTIVGGVTEVIFGFTLFFNGGKYSTFSQVVFSLPHSSFQK